MLSNLHCRLVAQQNYPSPYIHLQYSETSPLFEGDTSTNPQQTEEKMALFVSSPPMTCDVAITPFHEFHVCFRRLCSCVVSHVQLLLHIESHSGHHSGPIGHLSGPGFQFPELTSGAIWGPRLNDSTLKKGYRVAASTRNQSSCSGIELDVQWNFQYKACRVT